MHGRVSSLVWHTISAASVPVSANPAPKFSIIVPTFRRSDVLGRTIDALLATDYPSDRFEIIVVNDGDDRATRGVVNAVQTGPVKVTLICGRGKGAAAARNDGARAAYGDFLVFVDDDILVPPNHLTAQLEVRAVHGESITGADWWEFTPDVVSDLQATALGRYRLALEHSYRRRAPQRWTYPRGLATAHFTLRRTLFDELGGFDERFPYAGVEDWEFCLRAAERGCKLILDNDLNLLHNDKRLTISQLCTREERRGCSVGVLAAVRPQDYRDTEVMRENSPAQPGDPFRLRVRKSIKGALGRPIVLAALHRSFVVSERVLKPERLLHRLYTATISVHYLRGFRAGFASALAREGRAVDGGVFADERAIRPGHRH
jgi:GT2 family glycosyltransferase